MSNVMKANSLKGLNCKLRLETALKCPRMAVQPWAGSSPTVVASRSSSSIRTPGRVPSVNPDVLKLSWLGE